MHFQDRVILLMLLLLLFLMSGSLILEHLTTWEKIKTCFLLEMIVTLKIYLLVMIDVLVLKGLEQSI